MVKIVKTRIKTIITEYLYIIQKNEVRPLPHTIFKSQLQIDRRPKTVKLIIENIG